MQLIMIHSQINCKSNSSLQHKQNGDAKYLLKIYAVNLVKYAHSGLCIYFDVPSCSFMLFYVILCYLFIILCLLHVFPLFLSLRNFRIFYRMCVPIMSCMGIYICYPCCIKCIHLVSIAVQHCNHLFH